MPIRFQCICGHEITARDQDAGTQGRCPGCWEPVMIPGIAVKVGAAPQPGQGPVAWTIREVREPAAAPMMMPPQAPGRRGGSAWELLLVAILLASAGVTLAALLGVGLVRPHDPAIEAGWHCITIAASALALCRRER